MSAASIGGTMRFMRQMSGLSVKRAAKHFGTSERWLKRFERGEFVPICSALAGLSSMYAEAIRERSEAA